MYGILVSALATFGNWLLRAALLKGAVFGVLYWITVKFTEVMMNHLATAGNPVEGLSQSFSGLSSGALYFIGLTRLDVGIPMIFSAYATGFAIRRLPVIG